MDQGTRIGSPHAVSRAGVLDTLRVLRDVVLPTMGKGPLIRRRSVVGVAERLGLDDRAVRRLQALRRKHGPGPLLLKVPFRPQAVVLSAEDAAVVLAGAPEPFAPASLEKRSALDHFQPAAVLSSRGEVRRERRALNEAVLETGCPMHSLAARFALVADEEMREVCEEAVAAGVLDWDRFFVGWFRMVRRIVLGDAARDDSALTDLHASLRRRGNFAFLWPKDRRGRAAFVEGLRRYVEAGEGGSLAGLMQRQCAAEGLEAHQQLSHFLFAFDPGGMASYRALALLAVHPQAEARARAEIAGARGQAAPELPFLRACLLESLRLWPTTPAILRETTEAVAFGEGRLEAGTQVLIYAPLLHRDDERLERAHVFDPEPWVGRVVRPELGLVPFSDGPAVCPAAWFVPMVASLAMRAVLLRCRLELREAGRLPVERLPGGLDCYTLSFAATEAA